MASATELFESGDGDSISDRGDANVMRLFHVVVDVPDEGIREVLADFVLRSEALVGVGNAVQLGDPHPAGFAQDRFGLYAARFTVEQRVAPQNFIVRVDYMPSANYNFGTVPWLFSFSPGFGTRRATSIEMRGFDPVTGRTLRGVTHTDIGPKQYEREENGRYTATVIDSDGAMHHRRFRLGEGRRIEGTDVTFPIGSMTLSRPLNSYTETLHAFLMGQRNKTNTHLFLTRGPGRLKFVGPSVSSSTAAAGGSQSSGLSWDITLHFEDTEDVVDINVGGGRIVPFGFQLQDVWEEFGQTVAMRDSESDPPGDSQINYYKLYEDYPFDRLLSVLNAYA